MHYVVIGNSAAAIGCVEGIRSVDTNGKITLISNEPYHTYSRPLISYLLSGRTDERRMKYRPDDFYQKNHCTTRFGVSATAVDAEAKTVSLSDEEVLHYDRLLIATGSRPFIPPIDGLEQVKESFSFLSLDDAKALEAALTPKSRVLIVGAGLIGLKCAEGIQGRVKSITVVDLADRILPSILDEKGAVLVQRHIEKQGIKFYLSDGVVRFAGHTALLKSGESVDFDILVIAVGVRPNTELAAQAGALVNRGIVTGPACQTSLQDVYAAGDCSESYDITTGTNRILALLPNAYMQGETAGIHMAGGSAAYEKAIPMNAIGFFGLHMITAGNYDGEEYVEETQNSYKRLITKDNRLKGFILIGNIARAGIYTSLIREQNPLDEINYDLIKEKPQLMAFAASERAAKLGGTHG